MLGLRHELADRHVFDHAPAQRADGLVGHGGAPVLSEVVEHLDLRTGRFHRLRLLIITRAAPQAPYRERFSPLSSRAEELHLRALPEPYVNLSIHTAPDVRPLLNGFTSSTGSSRYRLAHDLG